MFFVPHGGSLVGFYGREGLADMVGASREGSGFSGVVFNYVVRSEARVDAVMDEAEKAGAQILKPAAALQWGGYGGSFADPDGYVWNIGYSAQGRGSALRRVGVASRPQLDRPRGLARVPRSQGRRTRITTSSVTGSRSR